MDPLTVLSTALRILITGIMDNLPTLLMKITIEGPLANIILITLGVIAVLTFVISAWYVFPHVLMLIIGELINFYEAIVFGYTDWFGYIHNKRLKTIADLDLFCNRLYDWIRCSYIPSYLQVEEYGRRRNCVS